MDTQKKNPYKRSVPLVQVTPVYHFQADEAGATLRATEVKPKLDRYLIRAAFGGKPELYKPYLIAAQSNGEADKDGEKRLALNYRLSISIEPSSPVEVVDLHVEQKDKNGKTITDRSGKPKKVFVGSIWDSLTPPKGTMLRGKTKISLNFFSRYPELLDTIEKWIDSFFAGENFGRRQSKGFGSFVTDACSKSFTAYDAALKKYMLTTAWAQRKELSIHYAARPGASTWKDALDDIRAIHKVLKSGENRPNLREPSRSTYIPSFLLKKYAKQHSKLQDYDNEKKTIKIKTLKKIKTLRGGNSASLRGRDAQDNSLGEPRFFRAMLGLPQFYEFRSVSINERDYMARVEIVDSKHNASGVERFTSPILYKPVKVGNAWRYYMIPEEIPEDMFSHRFDLQLVKSKDRFDVFTAGIAVPETITIQTPSADEFDLLDLLKQFSSTPQTIGYAYGGNRIQCSFGHLEIKKEERPDE